MDENGQHSQQVDYWTMPAFRAYVAEAFQEKDKRLIASFEEHDLRYEQRFKAQEQAVLLIREQLTALLTEMDKRHQQRFDAQEGATALALTSIRDLIAVHLSDINERFGASDKARQVMIDSQEKQLTAQMASQKEAITKAETATEKRLEGMNEFRGQLTDQNATMMPRAEAEQRIAALGEKIGLLKEYTDTTSGRSGGYAQSWTWAVAGLGTLFGFIGIAVAIMQLAR